MAPDTTMMIVKYWRNTPRSTPCSDHIKENEARSGGKTKRVKSVKFDDSVKEVNIIEHDDPIPKKKKEETG